MSDLASRAMSVDRSIQNGTVRLEDLMDYIVDNQEKRRLLLQCLREKKICPCCVKDLQCQEAAEAKSGRTYRDKLKIEGMLPNSMIILVRVSESNGVAVAHMSHSRKRFNQNCFQQIDKGGFTADDAKKLVDWLESLLQHASV